MLTSNDTEYLRFPERESKLKVPVIRLLLFFVVFKAEGFRLDGNLVGYSLCSHCVSLFAGSVVLILVCSDLTRSEED